MPVISEVGRLRKEDHSKLVANQVYISEFKTSLNYTVRSCLKQTNLSLA